MGKKKKKRKLRQKGKQKWLSLFYERSIATLSLIVSILTLYLGYIAYQKILIDRVKNEQLDLVISLVKLIHNDEITISTYPKRLGPMGTGHSIQKGNVFSIGTWDEYYIDYDIYEPGNFKWKLKTDDFLFNPLLPEKIAVSLLKFRTDFLPNDITKFENLERIKAIGMPKDSSFLTMKDINLGFFIGCRKYNNGMKGFVSNAKNISNEIISYFETNGIYNINPLIFEKTDVLYSYNQSNFDKIKRKFNYNNKQTHMYFEVDRNIQKKYDSLYDLDIDSTKRESLIEKIIAKEFLKIERLSDNDKQ